MRSMQVGRAMGCAVVASLFLSLTACSITGHQNVAATKQATQDRVNERVAAADKAIKAGRTDEAFEQLDAATKLDPASKAPWLKRAQIHFEAHQYGQAITASQEVLQRDVNDVTAKSILAVSGLRVSADALEQLRKVNEVNGSTRSEAEAVAKLIHEALGEPILVAQPASAPEPTKPSRNVRTVRPAATPMAGASTTPRTTTGAAPAPAAAPVAKSTTSSAAASGGRNNPFGALQ